ncbi:unnamed protein product [Arctogadus glacialis]
MNTGAPLSNLEVELNASVCVVGEPGVSIAQGGGAHQDANNNGRVQEVTGQQGSHVQWAAIANPGLKASPPLVPQLSEVGSGYAEVPSRPDTGRYIRQIYWRCHTGDVNTHSISLVTGQTWKAKERPSPH